MEYLIIITIFVFGLIIGSFLNVCIYRIPAGESIVMPPSHCPKCKKRLTPLDLVPVFSWLFLKGKCRHCGSKISPRYMLVELLTGLLFIGVYFIIGLNLYLLAALTLTALLITVTFIDIDTQTIPNGLMIFGAVVGIIFVAAKVVPDTSGSYLRNALDALYGALAGFTPLLVINLGAKLIAKKDGMGGGDMKLMAVVGLFLGLKLTVAALIIAVYLGGIAGAIILLYAKRKSRNQDSENDDQEKKGHYMAFGPFLAVGSLTSMLYGSKLIEWYMSLIIK